MTLNGDAVIPLPTDRLARLENFGHSLSGPAYLYRPTEIEQIEELFEIARRHGFSIGLRGAGRSYGDAALNNGGVVLDLQRMHRILDWNPQTGIIKVDPGVTIEQLWMHTLEDGWWSPVMPGTMAPTLGGCLASNVHGKNNWKAGPFGEYVLEFSALLPNGEHVVCSPTKNTELFFGLIGCMGILGVFTSITLQMKRIYSGNLDVFAWAEPNLKHILDAVDSGKEDNDYIVGWVDCTPRGSRIGRGQLHTANYLAPGDDPSPLQSLRSESQILPDTILGLVPKAIVWRFMRPAMNNMGVWAGNTAKYLANRTIGHKKRYLQSLVAFNFLLDYVPNWERAYGSGGLIQYQSFLPIATAYDAYNEMLKLSKRRGLPSYLGVVKRHRPDKFLLSHAVDGFSLALDIKVSKRKRPGLRKLIRELNKIVLQAGGRFYFAKDSTLTAQEVSEYLGEETVNNFKALKARCDPHNLLQTDLFRRCFTSSNSEQ